MTIIFMHIIESFMLYNDFCVRDRTNTNQIIWSETIKIHYCRRLPKRSVISFPSGSGETVIAEYGCRYLQRLSSKDIHLLTIHGGSSNMVACKEIQIIAYVSKSLWWRTYILWSLRPRRSIIQYMGYAWNN